MTRPRARRGCAECPIPGVDTLANVASLSRTMISHALRVSVRREPAWALIELQERETLAHPAIAEVTRKPSSIATMHSFKTQKAAKRAEFTNGMLLSNYPSLAKTTLLLDALVRPPAIAIGRQHHNRWPFPKLPINDAHRGTHWMSVDVCFSALHFVCSPFDLSRLMICMTLLIFG